MAKAHESYGMLGLIRLPSSTIQLPASLIVCFGWVSYVSSDFVERICCLTARLTGSVGGPGFVKVLGIPKHEGARRREVGKSVLDAFKG